MAAKRHPKATYYLKAGSKVVRVKLSAPERVRVLAYIAKKTKKRSSG